MTTLTRVHVSIDHLDDSGLGIAPTAEGRKVIVEDGLPGESGTAVVTHAGRNATRARMIARATTSASRRDPLPCARWTAASPCRVMHMAASAQAVFKADRVARALAAEALDPAVVAETVASPAEIGWRSRATYVVARRGSSVVLGAFRRGTHHVQPMLACPLESPAVTRTARALRAGLEAARAPIAGRYLVIDDGGCGAPPSGEPLERDLRGGRRAPGEPPRGRGIEYLDVRTDPAGRATALLVTDDGTLDDEESVVAAIRERCDAEIWIGRRGPGDALLAAGSARPTGPTASLEYESDGLVFEVSPSSFFQTHWEAASPLQRHAAQLATGASVLDVFAGVGAITLRIARNGSRVVGVESSARAVADARRNAERNDLGSRATFVESDALPALRSLSAEEAFDSVVLNPPRRGCGPDVIAALDRSRPDRVVYVSCNPASFARDARALAPSHVLRRATPYDLFPHSEHVEVLALFERR